MARRRNAAVPLILTEESKGNEIEHSNGSNQVSTIGSLLVPNFDQYYEQQIKCANVERYKLVVVGDEECGKTALLNTLVKSSDYEVEDSFATFDSCVTDIRTLQEHVEFTLNEISGMDDYSSLRIELYKGADVFLICFDIGRTDTLDSIVSKWAPEITKEFPQVPFLVIGCKNDLRTDSVLSAAPNEHTDTEKTTESVSRLRAERVAQNVGANGYVECCAKTRWNVDHVFRAAAEAILTKDDPKQDHITKHNSVLRRFSRLTSGEKNHSGLKRGSIFSFVVGSNNM